MLVLTSQLHSLLSLASANTQVIDLPCGLRKRDNRRKLRGFLDTYPDVPGKVYQFQRSLYQGASATLNHIRNDTSKNDFSSPRPPGSWTTPSLGPDARDSFNNDVQATSPSYTQMKASTEADWSRTTDSTISETLPEKLTSRLWLLMFYSIFLLYYSVHSVIVLFHHHGSGGSCVASGDHISAAQHIMIANSLSQPVLV